MRSILTNGWKPHAADNSTNLFTELLKMAPVLVSLIGVPELMLSDIQPNRFEVCPIDRPLKPMIWWEDSEHFCQMLVDCENLHSTAIAPCRCHSHARSSRQRPPETERTVVGICPKGNRLLGATSR